jgi:hypothetical protein
MSDLSLKPRLVEYVALPSIAEALLACATLVAIVSGGLVIKALGDIRALRVDLTVTRDELAAAQARVVGLEQQLEAAMQKQDRQLMDVRQIRDDRTSETPGARLELRLTQEETQLVRTYIKAPPASNVPATIAVGGDLTRAALLPLPAQIAGKVPRLVGGSFTIDRNGAIVIALRNSRVADAVIQPN